MSHLTRGERVLWLSRFLHEMLEWEDPDFLDLSEAVLAFQESGYDLAAYKAECIARHLKTIRLNQREKRLLLQLSRSEGFVPIVELETHPDLRDKDIEVFPWLLQKRLIAHSEGFTIAALKLTDFGRVAIDHFGIRK